MAETIKYMFNCFLVYVEFVFGLCCICRCICVVFIGNMFEYVWLYCIMLSLYYTMYYLCLVMWNYMLCYVVLCGVYNCQLVLGGGLQYYTV